MPLLLFCLPVLPYEALDPPVTNAPEPEIDRRSVNPHPLCNVIGLVSSLLPPPCYVNACDTAYTDLRDGSAPSQPLLYHGAAFLLRKGHGGEAHDERYGQFEGA